MSGPDSDGANKGINPYVGPQAFQKEDEWRFFGRRQETAELLARLTAHHLVLFYAQSGAGKSSLINAGLIPKLEERGFEVLPVGRVLGDAPPGVGVKNIYAYNLMTWLNEGQATAERLAELPLADFLLDLVHVDGRFVYAENEPELVESGTTEKEEPANVDEPFEPPPRALIVDQLEELFTSHPEAYEKRGDFFEQLAEAMEADPYLYVLLSMREDYLARIFPYTHLLPGELRTRFHMQRMKPRAALAAVRHPAASPAADRPFAPGVAEDLVDHLRRVRVQTETEIDETGENKEEKWAPGEFVEPVQLQVVCFQLWESLEARPGKEITRDELTEVARHALRRRERETGEIEEEPLAALASQALAAYYEKSLATVLADPAVDATESALRNWFSQKLITSTGTRNFLARGPQATAGLPETAVKRLEDRHLLRGETRAGGRWVELIHDSFIEPIQKANRQWEMRQPLLQQAQAWNDKERPEELLLSESQLEQLDEGEWRSLGDLVAEYVAAGREAVRRAAEERARRERERERAKQERELEQARKLAAEAEQRRQAEAARAQEEEARAAEAEEARSRQQWLTRLAFIFTVVAVLAATAAFFARSAASDARATAEAEATRAHEEAIRANEEASRANDNLLTATAAAATAVAAKNAADESAALASAREAEARESAALAEARRLVYVAVEFVNKGNVTGALLAGRELYNVSSDVEDATVQDQLNPLWLVLNRASDTLTQGSTFRRDVIKPSGVPIPNSLLAGPESESLAFIRGNQLHWWPVDVGPSEVQTVTLPITPTHAVFSADRSLFAAVDDSSVNLWQIDDGVDLIHNDTPSDTLELNELKVNGEIQAMTISHNGNHLAIAYCRPVEAADGDVADDLGTPTATPTPTSAPVPTPTPTAAGRPEQIEGTCEIWITEISDGQFSEGSFHTFKVGAGPIVDMAFVDDDSAVLLWASPEAINVLPRQPDTFEVPPAESERDYLTLAVIPNSDLLVVGGCMKQESSCRGEGFIRWWDLKQGVWLSAFEISTPVVGKLLYSSERQTLVGADATGRAREWQANVSDWPDLACEIAGRNMTVEEWEETFPASGRAWRDDPQTLQPTCSDYGLDLSFATAALRNCTAADVVLARHLYERSERPTADGQTLDYVEWTLPILVGEALISPEQETACLEIAGNAEPTIQPDAIDRETLVPLQEEVAGADLEDIRQLEETLVDANVPPALTDMLDTYLAALYGEACAFWTTLPEAACDEAARLQRRLADDPAVQLYPVLAERRDGWWVFVGNQGDFMTIAVDETAAPGAPSLVLRDIEGRAIASNGASSRPDGSFNVTLPEGGAYYVQAGPYRSPARSAPVVRRTEPKALGLGESIEVESDDERWWQFEGQQGDVITIAMDALERGDPKLRLLNTDLIPVASNDDGGEGFNALLQFLLPEDGTYYVDAGWLSSPGPYELSLTAVEPQMLAIGDTQEGTGEQRLWQFEGQQGDAITIAMDALEGGDPFLRLLNAEMVEVALAHDGGGPNALLQYLLPEDGTYYVEAGWMISPGPYELLLTAVEPQMLAIGDTREGAGEQRIWRFEGRQGEIIAVAMDALEGGDPYLRLLDADLVEVASDHDGGDGFNALLQFLLREDGTYYLDAGWTSGPGPYALSLASVELPMLAIGDIREGSSNERWWRFEGRQGNTVTIKMDALERGDPYLRLLDADLVEVASNNDGGDSLNALLQFLLPEDGTYHVDAGWLSSPGPYALSLTAVKPGMLAIGDTRQGAGEQRLWRFEGRQGDIIAIAMDALEGGDPYLRLLDSDLVEVASDHDGGDGLNALLQWRVPQDGAYYVEAEWTTSSGPYQLSLTNLEPQMLTIGDIREGTGEQRLWQFEGQQGDAIAIAMDALEGGDPHVRLLDAELVEVAIDHNGGDDFNALLQFLLSEDGTYYIDADWTSGSGPYELSLMVVEPQMLAIGDIREATGEERLWWLEGQQGDVVTVDLDMVLGNLQLMSGEGAILERSRDGSLTVALPEAGDYYLVIGQVSRSDRYSLSLSHLEDGSAAATILKASALNLVRQGSIEQGVALFERALNLDPDLPVAAFEYNYICWFGSLWQFAESVLFACNQAVAREPDNGSFADSRAVARAMLDDREGALEDFRFAVESGFLFNVEWRRFFIEELEAGRNPLLDEEWQERLRNE